MLILLETVQLFQKKFPNNYMHLIFNLYEEKKVLLEEKKSV